MNSSKCLQCGLVNFANAETCKRCGQTLSAETENTQAAQFGQPTTFGAGSTTAVESSGSLWSNDGFRKIIFGICWIIGGLILTQFTSYIFYGAIIFGGIDIVRGCIGMFSDADG